MGEEKKFQTAPQKGGKANDKLTIGGHRFLRVEEGGPHRCPKTASAKDTVRPKSALYEGMVIGRKFKLEAEEERNQEHVPPSHTTMGETYRTKRKWRQHPFRPQGPD